MFLRWDEYQCCCMDVYVGVFVVESVLSVLSFMFCCCCCRNCIGADVGMLSVLSFVFGFVVVGAGVIVFDVGVDVVDVVVVVVV